MGSGKTLPLLSLLPPSLAAAGVCLLSTRHCLSNAGATCLALLTWHVLWPRPSHSLCPTLSWQLTNTNPTLTTILPRPWAPLDREESARTSQVIVSLMPPPCPTVGGAVCADLRRPPPYPPPSCHNVTASQRGLPLPPQEEPVKGSDGPLLGLMIAGPFPGVGGGRL